MARNSSRYVRVNGKSKAAQKAMAEAKDIDQRLQQWQKAVRQLMAMQVNR